MKYLVTGGCGFIGSHLLHALHSQGHELVVVDDLSTGKREHLPSMHTTLHVRDIAEPGIFDDLLEGVDGCLHLAAIASVELSNKQWLRTHQVNIGGTVNLFDAVVRTGKKSPVVYASSAATYGDVEDFPLKENAHVHPLSAYGADKYACELYGKVAWDIHQIRTAGMRFFNVYGPRQDPASPYSGVITIFVNKLLKNEQLTINGDGKQARDFVFVEDVVQCLMRAMGKLCSGALTSSVFNVGTGKATSVEQLAYAICDSMHVPANLKYGPPRPGDPRMSLADVAYTQQQLSYTPSTPLNIGLSQTIDTMRPRLCA